MKTRLLPLILLPSISATGQKIRTFCDSVVVRRGYQTII
mgnify:CR=1 FL=1